MDRSEAVFKKMDRVRVTCVSRYTGEKGTVITTSDWVFSPSPEINYIVDLDCGKTVTCDPEDIELTDEDDE